jgi:hypothetical protein
MRRRVRTALELELGELEDPSPRPRLYSAIDARHLNAKTQGILVVNLNHVTT